MLPVLCPGNPLAKRPIPPPEGGLMQLLSWHGVEVAGVVLTGRMAGYLMALAGLWAGAIPALMAFDLAAFGRHSLVSDCPSAWLLVGLCIPSAE